MTLKLENLVKWAQKGYGRIGKTIEGQDADDLPPTFIHKMAIAGKFHDGQPVLSHKEERAMQKDVDALLNLLSNFHVADDFVELPDDYNQPRGPRKTPVAETKDVLIETPKEAEAPTEKRGRGWNLRKGAKDTKAATPEPAKAVEPAPKIRARKKSEAPVETPPVAEKRPRGWNLRKGAKDSQHKVTTVTVAEEPKKNVRAIRMADRKKPVEEPVQEKRGRGWNLQKGAKDSKATTPDVLITDNPPEVDARRIATRKNTGIATKPVKAEKEKLPAKAKSGRLVVA